MRKIIAREWLYLLSFCLFGFIVFPAIFTLFLIIAGINNLGFWTEYKSFFEAIGDGEFPPYLFASGPYLVFQFIRSVKWAIKMQRRK